MKHFTNNELSSNHIKSLSVNLQNTRKRVDDIKIRKEWKQEMAIKRYKPYTPSRRHMTVSAFDEITKSTPEKSLVVHLRKTSGRNNQGKLTVRHPVSYTHLTLPTNSLV